MNYYNCRFGEWHPSNWSMTRWSASQAGLCPTSKSFVACPALKSTNSPMTLTWKTIRITPNSWSRSLWSTAKTVVVVLRWIYYSTIRFVGTAALTGAKLTLKKTNVSLPLERQHYKSSELAGPLPLAFHQVTLLLQLQCQAINFGSTNEASDLCGRHSVTSSSSSVVTLTWTARSWPFST